MTNFVTVEVPCISIRHLSHWTRTALAGQVYDSAVAYVSEDDAEHIFVRALADRDDASRDLAAVLAWADKHAKFGWILLAVDGDVQPDLSIY
jgi:hypothetical protein